MSHWYKAGTGLVIDGDNLAMRSSANAWKTAYGSDEVKSGKHEWKVKIIKHTNDQMIGVTSTIKHLESSYWSQSDTYCYAYYSGNGNTYDKQTSKKYGEAFNEGDVIGIHLDIDNQCIWFSKNGKNQGNAYTDINKDVSYRLTVALYAKDSELKVLSYINASDEQKEDVKQDDGNFIENATESVIKECAYLTDKCSTQKIQGLDIKGLSATSKYFGKLQQDIEKLEAELTRCKTKLSQKQNVLKQRMSVNVQNYKKWTMDEVELYLNGLENGRYTKYVEKLLKGFKNDSITASNLPELDQGDLRQFGMENFNDRKELRKHFQKLAQGNEGGSTY